MKCWKLILFSLVVSVSSDAIAEESSCPRAQPDFYDDVYNQWHGKNIAYVGAHIQLVEYLEKPYDPQQVLDWIQVFQIDSFCLSGEPNRKRLRAKTKGVLVIPPEHSNTGSEQALVFSSAFTFDPDRGQASEPSYNNTILDLTESLIRQ